MYDIEYNKETVKNILKNYSTILVLLDSFEEYKTIKIDINRAIENTLGHKEKYIIQEVLIKGRIQSDVSRELNITQQVLSRKIQKTINKLVNYLNN
ncbi:MAG: hypothetical protein ACRDBY_14275 [Cetobacterium sp.]